MDGLISMICIISFLQIGIIVLMIFFYYRIKLLMELESECIRFDVLMTKMLMIKQLNRPDVNKSLPETCQIIED